MEKCTKILEFSSEKLNNWPKWKENCLTLKRTINRQLLHHQVVESESGTRKLSAWVTRIDICFVEHIQLYTMMCVCDGVHISLFFSCHCCRLFAIIMLRIFNGVCCVLCAYYCIILNHFGKWITISFSQKSYLHRK